ncbi:unnamed protein product [Pleuronectes platessa]|uniref:Uncharacterized protein n=1 Tax=Pleuronectes platessa TaxID=8262 RepID=A0A9N7TXD1_PLEPL|nr:unnamed protein product [Pleuronectes platessa]
MCPAPLRLPSGCCAPAARLRLRAKMTTSQPGDRRSESGLDTSRVVRPEARTRRLEIHKSRGAAGGSVAAQAEEKLRVKMEGILSDRIGAAGAPPLQTDSQCVRLAVL